METMLIGIPDMGPDPFRIYMFGKYAAGVRRAGGEVEKLPWGVDDDNLRLIVENWDGLLLPGGPDIDPALYGEKKEPACGEPNVHRDDLETRLLRIFLETGRPILGICRGLQVLNVVRGGTLLQDIAPTQTAPHSDFLRRKRGVHAVTVTPGSLLSTALGAESARVNSMHHQAAGRVGEGLAVTARSEDGYIEALELPDHPFCLAVQWHPEHMAEHCPEEQAIFDLFLMACRRERGKRLQKAIREG